MRPWIFAVIALCGCATHPAPPGVEALSEPAGIELRDLPGDAREGTDERPRVLVVVRTAAGDVIERAALAAVRFGDGAAYVDATTERLVAIDLEARERELAVEIAGAPVASADGARLAWTEPGDLLRPALRTMGAADGNPVTIAIAPGAMSPLAFLDGGPARDGVLALVGSVNGGVAGLWLAEARGGGALTCVTNCALRAGQPWGDAYVPPPGDAASIRIDGERVRFVAADGEERSATLGAAGAR